mgnify:CR=1 FL=1
MGIKNLNSFLEKHAKLAITEQNLSKYKNKKIGINTFFDNLINGLTDEKTHTITDLSKIFKKN